MVRHLLKGEDYDVGDLAAGALRNFAIGEAGAAVGRRASRAWQGRRRTPAPAADCPLLGRCLSAGTLVQTPAGLVPIEQVGVGDEVLAYEEETGAVVAARVLQTIERTVDSYYEIDLGETVIEATAEHPFWVEGSGWIEVAELRAGMVLATQDGLRLTIDRVERVEGVRTVHNFEVEGLKNYFVSPVGVLVHNCGGEVTPIKSVGDRLYGLLRSKRDPTVRRWFRTLGSSRTKSVHGNHLDASGPHDVYALLHPETGEVLRFGETGRGHGVPHVEWIRRFEAEFGIEDVDIRLLGTVEGKRAARELETKYIRTFARLFGGRPRFQRSDH